MKRVFGFVARRSADDATYHKTPLAPPCPLFNQRLWRDRRSKPPVHGDLCGRIAFALLTPAPALAFCFCATPLCVMPRPEPRCGAFVLIKTAARPAAKMTASTTPAVHCDGAQIDKPDDKKLPKPYNNYNLFFVLERARIIKERLDVESPIPAAIYGSESPPTTPSVPGYEYMVLPPLPPRYQHLASTLPPNWYVPGKNKNALVKRKHVRMHGGEWLQ